MTRYLGLRSNVAVACGWDDERWAVRRYVRVLVFEMSRFEICFVGF